MTIKLSDQVASDYNNARQSGQSLPQVIIERHHKEIDKLHCADFWPQIIAEQEAEQSPIDIVTPKQSDWRPNVLERYSEEVRKSIKFPPNSCLLHGLGCLSVAMSRHFTFRRYEQSDDELPVALFCVSGQPPSTGKSGVNSAFINPVRLAYEAINTKNKIERDKVRAEVDELRKELKGASISAQACAIEDKLFKLGERMAKLPDYIAEVSDSTPEGLEKIAIKQDGWVNIISAEAEAINVILGSVYGDGSRKANNGIFLSMWSGEWMSVSRSSREAFRGYVKGSCSVLAQPETVDAVLEAGKQGRGISERFLLINEPNLLGKRNHHIFTPINKAIKAEYHALVNEIVNDGGTCFVFDDKAIYAINEYRNIVEAQMIDSGRYNDSMIRGYMGKAGEQIQRIACVLWAAKEWGYGGSKSNRIGVKTAQRAIDIFTELSVTYLQAAEKSGCAGLGPKVSAVKKYLAKKLRENAKAKKVTVVTASQLQQSLKRNSALKSIDGLTQYLTETILPELERQRIVLHSKGKYYANPRLIEIDEEGI